jgi:nucleotide-binding universal stress UspA family protein
MAGPILFCFDGSEGSRSALSAAGELIARPSDGFVVTVWQPAYLRLALAGTFGPAVLTDEADADAEEAAYAQQVAEQGAGYARDHGYDLAPVAERAEETIADAILGVADRYDVKLIVCGQRGRGPLRSTLLGSVSHTLSAHTKRPILIAPEHPLGSS